MAMQKKILLPILGGYMSKVYGRKDRTARLLKLQMLLHQYSDGLALEEIARKCSVSTRTVFRDLKTLDSELGIPIWGNRGQYGIVEGYFLPPISLTIIEAVQIFLAARLMQSLSNIYNPSMISAFYKINTIIHPSLRKQIQNTIEYMEKQPRNERKINNLIKLTQAWLSQHRVIIKYLNGEDEPEETIIEPYFIEPSALGRSLYVIAYCHLKKSIRTFKVDRIAGDVSIRTDNYKIPSEFNAVDYLGSTWGIHTDQDLSTVKLHFSPKLGRNIKETIWHSSQEIMLQDDGSIIVTFRVRNTLDFRAWILAWGGEIKVLEPNTLRNQIVEAAQSILDINASEGITTN